MTNQAVKHFKYGDHPVGLSGRTTGIRLAKKAKNFDNGPETGVNKGWEKYGVGCWKPFKAIVCDLAGGQSYGG